MVFGSDRNWVSIQGEAGDEIDKFGIDFNWLVKPNLVVMVLAHKEFCCFFLESSKVVDDRRIEVGFNLRRRDISCVIQLRPVSDFCPILGKIVFIQLSLLDFAKALLEC